MPPPPPPPPGPPPPPLFPAAPPPSAGADPKSRNLLLQEIREGTRLKKTVTKDRSGPFGAGKILDPSSNDLSNSRGTGYRNSNTHNANTISRVNGLGSLFPDGIPKLKPTRPTSGGQSSSVSTLAFPNNSTLHNNLTNAATTKTEVKKRTIDTKNRGPPPPAPSQKPIFPTSISETPLTGNSSSHTRSLSNVSQQNGSRTMKGPGKPQLAPKPPAPAPPRKPPISRVHSMRLPSSPSIIPAVPTCELSKEAPTFYASADNLLRTRPRGPLRPPSDKPPPPPRNPVPPPPPPSQPPPPPPPHRTSPSLVNRVAPPLPVSIPPQPPQRHSSMKNGSLPRDFESRFGDMFHSVDEFPPPPSFRSVPKVYNSKTAKQQAPQPPAMTHIQLGNKMWARDTSTC